MQIVDCEQGSELWHATRLGVPTGSTIKKLASKTKLGELKNRQKYAINLRGKALGISSDYESPAMAAGSLGEANALARLSFETGIDFERVGFIWGDDTRTWGVSPDAVLFNGDAIDDGAEIKRLGYANHSFCEWTGQIPAEHFPQVAMNLYCCKAKQWHFRCQMSDTEPQQVRDAASEVTVVLSRGDARYIRWVEIFERGIADFVAMLDKMRAAYGLCPISDREIDQALPRKVIAFADTYESMVSDGIVM